MGMNEWKARAITKLVELSEKTDNERIKREISILIKKINYASLYNLADIFYDVHTIAESEKFEEIMNVIPSEEELVKILREASR
ncbi:MAG: hypothetical protein JTT12_05655 [Candidatus Brockarchaeota archaeon]|nr:hypothetical protein [Candidatus Brockarchaeota archaeon]